MSYTFLKKERLPSISELPDPFLKPDGSRVAVPEEWRFSSKSDPKTILSACGRRETKMGGCVRCRP